MRVIFYRVLKRNLNLALFIFAPLLLAFLTLVGSISAIDHITGQMIQEAIDTEPDLIVTKYSFKSLRTGDIFVDELENEPYISDAHYFHYAVLNGFVNSSSTVNYTIEDFSLFNFYSFPNSTLEPLGLTIPDNHFYASADMVEHYNLSVGSEYLIPIFTIEVSSSNSSDLSYISRCKFPLIFRGTINNLTSDFSSLHRSDSYDLKQNLDASFLTETADSTIPEFTIVISSETMINTDPWINYQGALAYFLIDYNSDDLEQISDPSELIEYTKDLRKKVEYIINHGYNAYFINYHSHDILRTNLEETREQAEDLWLNYSLPIVVILTFPLFVTLGVVQRQIAENRNLISNLYSRGATRWMVGGTLILVCLFFDVVMFLIMLFLDRVVLKQISSQGAVQTQSSLSIIIFLTVFIASLQFLAIWTEILSKAKYTQGINLQPTPQSSAKSKLIFFGVISFDLFLLYLFTRLQTNLPLSDNLNQTSWLIFVTMIVGILWGIWKIGLPLCLWLITQVYRMKVGKLSHYLMRGVRIPLNITRQMFFLSFILCIILALIFSFYDAKDAYYYQLYDEQFGGDVMVRTSGMDWERVIEEPGIEDYCLMYEKTVYSKTGESLRLIMVNASKHGDFIHVHGKYNVEGSTLDLFSALEESNGVLMSAAYASDNSYRIDSLFEVNGLLPNINNIFSVEAIFTRFLPTVRENADLVIDYDDYFDIVNETASPSFLMLKIDNNYKDSILSLISHVSSIDAKPMYYNDERYQNYEDKASVKAKNFMFGIFSLTAIIGINLILTVSLSRAKDERIKIMRVLNARGFSVSTFGQLFLIAFTIAVLFHVIAGIIIGNLIYTIVILISDQFLKIEYPKFGSDYQTQPKPMQVISNETIFWGSALLIVLILWNLGLLLYYRFRVVKSAEFKQEMTKGAYKG